jgi:hypothetical protein
MAFERGDLELRRRSALNVRANDYFCSLDIVRMQRVQARTDLERPFS